ncbi:hypothetical protein pdam_00021766 [Pocillopora damicornis]|uniref:Uncharacterized protein n=1 Tax=Pocillopora damicornis TaxID=46731 RepID=A0A3M6T4M9_POCDA|nr:hypothetical protein pdam_00021766 [Pocillopora damicornis]
MIRYEQVAGNEENKVQEYLCLTSFPFRGNMIKPVVVTLLLSLCVANSLIICGRNGGVPCPNGKRELQKQVKYAVDKPARPLAKLKKGTGVFLMKRKDLVEI